jgi:hypothetical protein
LHLIAPCCRCCSAAFQLREAVASDQTRVSSQAGQLEAWQSQLAEQQARLEELEQTAAEALAEARDAAAAALQDRDQVGPVVIWKDSCWVGPKGLAYSHRSMPDLIGFEDTLVQPRHTSVL